MYQTGLFTRENNAVDLTIHSGEEQTFTRNIQMCTALNHGPVLAVSIISHQYEARGFGV